MSPENDKELPLILLPLGSILDSCWIKDYTPSGYIEMFCEWQLIDEFLYKVVFNNFDSVLGFGRYGGATIEQIIEIDASYLEFCIRELGYFYLSSRVILGLINSGYIFSNETINKYRLKLQDYKSAIYLNNKHIEDIERREERDEEDWNCNVDSNPYYEDDLDMDQQSQEFWDNL